VRGSLAPRCKESPSSNTSAPVSPSAYCKKEETLKFVRKKIQTMREVSLVTIKRNLCFDLSNLLPRTANKRIS
jgi:hypothetical protein